MPHHRPEVTAAAAADVLVGILADHMEPIEVSGEAAADAEGSGRGRIALLVNRPGVTFGGLRIDDKKGQQWIAKVMEPEQEAFERARFERAGARYAPEPIGSLAGCLYDGRAASILVQVRAPRGTAEDALRAYEDARFADDWQLWASLEAFLRLRAPQAARTAAAAIYRASAAAASTSASANPHSSSNPMPEARAIWAARYAEVPPCSCAEVLLSAARRRRPDLSDLSMFHPLRHAHVGSP